MMEARNCFVVFKIQCGLVFAGGIVFYYNPIYSVGFYDG